MRGRVAVVEDTNEIVRMLAEAFFLDPVWGWALGDPIHRKPQHEPWFRLLVTTASYQASSPSPSWKVPVGPSLPMVAMRTMTSAPSSTG